MKMVSNLVCTEVCGCLSRHVLILVLILRSKLLWLLELSVVGTGSKYVLLANNATDT